jgi:hypothetical protein
LQLERKSFIYVEDRRPWPTAGTKTTSRVIWQRPSRHVSHHYLKFSKNSKIKIKYSPYRGGGGCRRRKKRVEMDANSFLLSSCGWGLWASWSVGIVSTHRYYFQM